MLLFQNLQFFILQHNQLQVLFFSPLSTLMIAHLPLSVKQHLVTSIYLQINSTQIPKEASKKFHTFVAQRAKWPQGRGGDGYGLWGWGRGEEGNKMFTDEVVINV